MPKQSRFSTKYPGVYYVEGTAVGRNEPERIFYIRYRKGGKIIEEKAGRQFQDDMTAARAASLRAKRIEGDQFSNEEQRKALQAEKEAEKNRWTIDRLWEEYKAQGQDKLKGLRFDENRYLNHIAPRLGNMEPRELVQLEIDRLRIGLLKRKKPQTVKHILALLRRIINFGVKKRLCSIPEISIEMPSVDNEKTEDLSTDELGRLLESIEQDSHPQAGPMMKMALFTGMRRGELFKLQWQDIDFHRGFIFIRDPKGGPGQKIPLNDGAKQILENHSKTASPYVFPGRNGCQRTEIKNPVNRIKERAGLPKDFRALHGLRHVYASLLASSGQVDMYTLQKLLTHKSAAMTQRYAHLRDETLKRASDLAGEISANP